MTEKLSLFRVMKSESEKVQIICENVLIMLSNRIYIDKKGNKQQLLDFDKAQKQMEDRGDYTYVVSAENGERYAFKIIFQVVTTIGKQSIVSEFINEFAGYRKIIIARDFNKKISDHVARNQTQIFRESSLLSNLIDYRDQPIFELLSPSEMNKVKEEYNLNDYTIDKYLRSDPIVKYFDLKKGHIIRIVRPSPTSGRSIGYRIVV